MAGDLVVCEFAAYHFDVMKICGRILSNNRKSHTYLKLCAGRVEETSFPTAIRTVCAECVSFADLYALYALYAFLESVSY